MPPEATTADQTLDLGDSTHVNVEGIPEDPTDSVWADLLAGPEPDPDRWTYWHHVGKLGKSSPAVFTCTRSGEVYTLVVGDLAGHIAYRSGLHGGEHTTVSLAEGLSIQGRVLSEVDLDHEARVRVEPTGFAVAKDDGSFTMKGLPPGKWRVTATATSGGQNLFAEGVAESGSRDVELVLHVPEAAK